MWQGKAIEDGRDGDDDGNDDVDDGGSRPPTTGAAQGGPVIWT